MTFGDPGLEKNLLRLVDGLRGDETLCNASLVNYIKLFLTSINEECGLRFEGK